MRSIRRSSHILDTPTERSLQKHLDTLNVIYHALMRFSAAIFSHCHPGIVSVHSLGVIGQLLCFICQVHRELQQS